jgi:long-chain acyl-CoA synthetase
MPLRNLIAPALQSAPDRLAIVGHSSRLTYREFDQRVNRLAAHWLGSDLRPFDRVALWMRNSPELLIAYFACWKASLIPVPIDLRYQPAQIRFILSHSGARAIVVDSEKQADLQAIANFADLAQVIVTQGPANLPDAVTFDSLLIDSIEIPDWPPMLGDHLATIFYTSGTTSRPKGVIHSSQRIGRRIQKIVRECRIHPGSVSLTCSSILRPMAFQMQALAVLQAGGCMVTLPRFSPDAFWQSFAEPPAKTLLAFTPDMLSAVLNHPAARSADFSSLELCLVGSDKAPPSLHALFRDITGLELVEMCGMTETGPYAMNPPFDQKRPGSIGQAMEGVLLRIVDEDGEDVPAEGQGQILVRSPDAMIGYWNDSLTTFQMIRDGWIYTGDQGRCDPDGYVWFCGRIKDLIVRDGRNLSPLELEAVLSSHPAVQEAVVVGVDDPPHGQAVEAFVCWRSGISTPPTTQELRTYVASDIEALALPRAIYAVKEWPRTAQGKIDRKRLQWIAAAGGINI